MEVNGWIKRRTGWHLDQHKCPRSGPWHLSVSHTSLLDVLTRSQSWDRQPGGERRAEAPTPPDTPRSTPPTPQHPPTHYTYTPHTLTPAHTPTHTPPSTCIRPTHPPTPPPPTSSHPPTQQGCRLARPGLGRAVPRTACQPPSYLVGVHDGDAASEQAAEQSHQHRLHHEVLGHGPVLHRRGGSHRATVLRGRAARSGQGPTAPGHCQASLLYPPTGPNLGKLHLPGRPCPLAHPAQAAVASPCAGSMTRPGDSSTRHLPRGRSRWQRQWQAAGRVGTVRGHPDRAQWAAAGTGRLARLWAAAAPALEGRAGTTGARPWGRAARRAGARPGSRCAGPRQPLPWAQAWPRRWRSRGRLQESAGPAHWPPRPLPPPRAGLLRRLAAAGGAAAAGVRGALGSWVPQGALGSRVPQGALGSRGHPGRWRGRPLWCPDLERNGSV